MKLSKPSPAMIVALVGVFLGLGGVGVAATGGNFILGQPNTADKTTALSSNVTTGPTLQLTNTSTKPAARFTTSSGVAPFAVDRSTRVANLNADQLDAINSTGFVRGKSAQVVSSRITTANDHSAPFVPIITVPGFGTLKGQCPDFNGSYMYFFSTDTSGWEVIEKYDGSAPVVITSPSTNVVQDARPGGDHFTLGLGHGVGTSALTATVDVFSNWDSTNGCTWQAQAVVSQGS